MVELPAGSNETQLKKYIINNNLCQAVIESHPNVVSGCYMECETRKALIKKGYDFICPVIQPILTQSEMSL